MIRVAVREKFRLKYTARRLTTGLTDVKLDIYRPNGTKVLDQATCSELANGVYYYDWTSANTGNFIAIFDSVTQPSQDSQSINVFGRSTKFGQALRPTGGGVTRKIIQKGIWKEEEKDLVLRALKTLLSHTSNKELEEISEMKEILLELSKKPEVSIPDYGSLFGSLRDSLDLIRLEIKETVESIKFPDLPKQEKFNVEELENKLNDLAKQTDLIIKELDEINRIQASQLSNQQLEEALKRDQESP